MSAQPPSKVPASVDVKVAPAPISPAPTALPAVTVQPGLSFVGR